MPKVFSVVQFSNEFRILKETIVRNTTNPYSSYDYEHQRKMHYIGLARQVTFILLANLLYKILVISAAIIGLFYHFSICTRVVSIIYIITASSCCVIPIFIQDQWLLPFVFKIPGLRSVIISNSFKEVLK